MSNNLQLFWQIASSSQEERLRSSNQLISDLLEQQSALASSSKATLDNPVTVTVEEDDHSTNDPLAVSDKEAHAVEEAVGNTNAADLTYALRRLIRGLASPRENSRLGFAVALTQLLSSLETVTAYQVLVLILKYSTPVGTISRQEQRDLMFAKLFGVLTLIQSRILFRESATLAHFTRAIQVIFLLANSKAWMAESCGWVVTQSISYLATEKALEWKQQALEWIASKVTEKRQVIPEKLAILIKLQQSGLVINSLEASIVPPFQNQQVLSSANLHFVARILKDATVADTDDSTAVAKGHWRPQIHFVWDVILDCYFSSKAEDRSVKLAPFPEFFRVVVDESLFAPTSSMDRKSWGFQVFERALPRASDNDKPLLFTPNFMRSLINQLASQDRFLHKAAVKAVSAIQEVVKNNPKIGFTLVSQLIGQHGNKNFDKITKTKTVEGVLSSLDSERLHDYIHHLGDLICQNEETSDQDTLNSINGQRKWALDQMLSVIRTHSIPKDDALVVDVLEFLAGHGYFTLTKPLKKGSLLDKLPKPEFPDSIREMARSRFLSCLSELSDQVSVRVQEDGTSRKTQGIAQSGELWLAKAHNILTRFEKDSQHFKSIFEQDKEIAATMSVGVACLGKIRKIESTCTDAVKKEQLRGFQTMLLAGLIVSTDAADGASDLVQPLCDCAEALFPSSVKKSKAKKRANNDADDAELQPIELFVECILNFLDLPSAFLRSVTEHAFEAFTGEMTTQSLDMLLSSIGPQDAANEMEVDGDGDDEGEGSTSKDKGTVKDKKSSDTLATSDNDEDDDEDQDVSDSDGEEEEEDDENEPVDVELREKVKAALCDSGMADSDGEEEKADDDDDDDAASESSVEFSDLDDDQMMLLDDKLAEIFRQRTAAARAEKEAKREASILQNKVLDVLEIFAKKESANALIVRLIAPLFHLATEQNVSDKQIVNKATNILRARICKGKETPNTIKVEDIAEDLVEIHKSARSTTDNEVASLVQAINLYLTKVALASEPVVSNTRLVEIYRDTLHDFMTRKASHLKPAFLVDSFRRFPSLGWAFRHELLDHCRPGAAAHSFRQAQAMQMIQAAMTQLAQLSEKEEIVSFIPEISKCFCEVVVSATSNDNSSALNANRLKEIVKFLLQAARISKKATTLEEIWKSAWNLGQLHQAADQLEQSERFKSSTSIHALLKQLFAVLEGKEKISQPLKKTTSNKRSADDPTITLPVKKSKTKPTAKKVKTK